MRYEDIKVGMKVRALRKSEIPESWGNFIDRFPGGVAEVTNINDWNSVITVGSGFYFLPSDLEPVIDSPSATTKPSRPITIKSLRDAGSCREGLIEFTKTVVEKDPRYAYDEIPVDIAIEAATKAGSPTWLEENGFVEKKRVNIIEQVFVRERPDYYWIGAKFPGYTGDFSVIHIQKDGSGIYLIGGLSEIKGLTTTETGTLVVKD